MNTPRRAHNQARTPPQLGHLLAHGFAANQQRTAQAVDIFQQRLHRRQNLRRQFPRGGQNQGMGRRVLHQIRHHRQRKGQGFPRPRLGGPQNIPPLQGQRNDILLNGGGGDQVKGLKVVVQNRRKIKIRK